MARYVQPTEQQLAGWREWVESRPEVIKKLAERFDPWTLYKMKSTDKLVTVSAFNEDNTLTVNITAEFNELMFERSVFGINPDDLEEAELPEKPGFAIFDNEQVEDNIDKVRVMVRPDLWELDEDGKAVRKK